MINSRHVFYAPVLFGASGLLFLKSVVYARLFSVESFGMLNQAMLIATTFASFAGVGLQLLGQKVLPQYHALGDQRAIDDLIGSAIAVFGLAAVLAAVSIGIAVLAGWVDSAASWYSTLLYATAQFLFLLRLIDINSALRFLDHAMLSTLRAILLLAIGAAVAAATRDVAATLATEGVVTMLLAARLFTAAGRGPAIRKVLDLGAERRWLAGNLPSALRLLWLNGAATVLYAIDRWAGIAVLSERYYGIFALGLLVILVFDTLQAVINVAAYPLMSRMIARSQHQRAFRLATLASVLVFGLTVVCYRPFVLLLDFLVREYLPLYAEGIDVIKLAVVAGALRLADFYTTFAILCDQERRLALSFGGLAAIAVVVIWAAHVFGDTRFDPGRMVLVTVGISACAFLIKLSVAVRAYRLRYPRVGAI